MYPTKNDLRSQQKDYPLELSSGRDHVEAVASALATFGNAARAPIDASDELRDKDTADIFTEVSHGVDKWLWFRRGTHAGRAPGKRHWHGAGPTTGSMVRWLLSDFGLSPEASLCAL